MAGSCSASTLYCCEVKLRQSNNALSGHWPSSVFCRLEGRAASDANCLRGLLAAFSAGAGAAGRAFATATAFPAGAGAFAAGKAFPAGASGGALAAVAAFSAGAASWAFAVLAAFPAGAAGWALG